MKTDRNEYFSEKLNHAWSVVEKSRHPQRPHTIDYLSTLFTDFEEFKGDRNFAEDEAIIAGVGSLKSIGDFPSQNVVFIGQEKGRTSKEKQKRKKRKKGRKECLAREEVVDQVGRVADRTR